MDIAGTFLLKSSSGISRFSEKIETRRPATNRALWNALPLLKRLRGRFTPKNSGFWRRVEKVRLVHRIANNSDVVAFKNEPAARLSERDWHLGRRASLLDSAPMRSERKFFALCAEAKDLTSEDEL